jgi:membrane glycosyltransferase
MRRGGWAIHMAPKLGGSYEESPPTLSDFAARDRRWCQGNLQNARLLTEPGLHAVHRGMLLTGAMAYLSAPLWLVYVALGAMLWMVGGNVFFTSEGKLTVGVLSLWAATISMLVMPRLLGVAALVMNKEQRFYGGTAKLVKSAFIEFGLSAMQAPLRMVAHTIFVVAALTGLKLEWKSPPREATDVSWQEARQSFAKAGLTVLAIAAVLALVHPPALLWLLPVGIPLLLAIPFTVLTSRSSLGEKVRQSELLLVPEESWTPSVLRRAWHYAQQSAQPLGWNEVLDNPRLCAVVSGAMGQRRTSQGLRGHARRARIEQLAAQGAKPTPAEVMRFMSEPGSLQQLRAAVMFPRAGAEARMSSTHA